MTPEETMNNLFAGLLKQYWWFFLLVLFWPVLKLFMPIIKGKIGEGVVNLAAKLRLDPKVYHLLKDVTIPSKNGTTQIDHVIVSKFGLFVIETKNYRGWIFADAKSPKWTQVNFKQKHRFQNPLRQNYAHICALSELLGCPKDQIHGVVCFMGDAKFKNGVPEGVFLEGRYVNHIESFQTPVFSADEVAGIVRQIESGRLARGFKTNRAHVEQLKSRRIKTAVTARDYSSTSEKNDVPSQAQALSQAQVCLTPQPCPACGAKMILRTAKRGANAGNQFWGCSNYPACKSILPFAG
jgi:predicted RNA-binding Zn-ribbon protein involved in translation (DUF1610 family)